MTIVETLRGTVARVKSSYENVEEADIVMPEVLRRVAQHDLRGARAKLLKWRGTMSWRKTGNNYTTMVILTLLDKMTELQEETVERRSFTPEASFCPQRDEYAFSNSTHLSLLTAAVLRQRSQINDLLTLVDHLSHRLG